MSRLFYSVLLLLLSSAISGSAGEVVDFAQDIEPIFANRCYDCHDEETQKGGVGLANYYQSHQPTDSGEAILKAGDLEHSALFKAVTEADPDHRMPPKGDPLTEKQIATLKNWIEQGAQWPDDGWRPEIHWSYVKPERPEVPEANAGNEIDAFIRAKLVELKIQPNQPANPASLLRRLYLDVTGLPPSVAEVDAFLKDPSTEAYSAKLDELLASPHFGERWARHWLDLARYADSEGYQRDELREVWPYRDWVIAALNSDMPFDQFTIEQIAGDLLPNATLEQKIATGFHRNAMLNLEAGTDPNEDHYKQIVDRVNTTGAVWLGTTLGCAQCHNHKYDPISISEYYQMFAFFNNTPHESKQSGKSMGMSGMKYIGPDLPVPRDEKTLAEREPLQVKWKQAEAGIRALVDPKWEETAADKDAVKKLPTALKNKLKLAQPKRKHADYALFIKHAMKGDKEAKSLIDEYEKYRLALRPHLDGKTRVMSELPEPRETFVAKRGDFLTTGAQVEPDIPAALHTYPEGAPRNRLGLAQWLTSKDNPLVARVTVNRFWAEIFGEGLVPTLEEFGKQGEPATHPELLDWLAVTFIEDDGWSIKSAIRRIFLSETYQQSTQVRSEAAAIDPKNQYLWRHSGHRYDAETIRDNALSISGLLSKKMGGPPTQPHQPEGVWRKSAGSGPTVYEVSIGDEALRRGIYTIWRRSAHYPSFANFDATSRGTCVVKRDRSNTPLQALTLLNDQAYHEMANAFARKMANEYTGDVEDRLELAFRTVLARSPEPSELETLRYAWQSEVDQKDGTDMAGYYNAATILLNLHETITRG